jgi:DNA end-binding protein Ku
MALRSLWKGTLQFSLVSVPVEAFSAAEPDQGEIHFHQLHRECNSRIRYKKTCPIHGEVRNDEIVLGHEYERGKYVLFERDELDKRRDDEHLLKLDTFVEPDQIDPIYFDGRTYYLAPQSQAAQSPYAVLCQAMAKLQRYGVATIVLHGKEELVLVRPLDGVLTMTMLYYQSQVRSPSAVADKAEAAKPKAVELKLAQQLIEASTSERFDFSRYEDQRTEHLHKLIEAKIAGKEIVAEQETDEEIPVVNFMDALRKSVKQQKHSPKSQHARKALSAKLSKPTHARRKAN